MAKKKKKTTVNAEAPVEEPKAKASKPVLALKDISVAAVNIAGGKMIVRGETASGEPFSEDIPLDGKVNITIG